ncbi:MAG TPA: hypothetical protein VH394_20525 [Thermoanaerobaculia bacterium]|jgi:hypothetical protein|nr:hypothetical protein [Thermoanaerobaculia bacterium]
MESKGPGKVYRRFLLELRELPALARSNSLALEDFLRARLELIERLYRDLGNPTLRSLSQDELTVVGCRLEDLYTAFEALFQRISDEYRRLLPAGRRSVLDRMRPAVIDREAHEKLAVLARFRHDFRQIYGRDLEPQEVEPALSKALELRAIYRPQLEAFMELLRRVG